MSAGIPSRVLLLTAVRNCVWLALIWVTLASCAAMPVSRDSRTKDESQELFDVPFVTNRNLETNRNRQTFIGDERGADSWGYCSVALEKRDRLKGDPVVRSIHLADKNEVLDSTAQSTRVLLYVHGYNIGFEKGCRRAALLQNNLELQGRVLLFSWPADGNFLNYVSDVADLQWSVATLELLLESLIERYGAENLDLLGHSLGARGLVGALRELQLTDPFHTLTLVAPDIDRDLFMRDAPSLSGVAERTTVYVASFDRALALSRRLNGHPRLGEAVDLDELTTALNGFQIVDVSPSGASEVSGHLYHLYNPVVVHDLKVLLETYPGELSHRVISDGVIELMPFE